MNKMKRIFSSLIIAVLVCSSILATPAQVQAATTTIQVTANSSDSSYGQNAKICTLREAIYAINHKVSFDGCVADAYTNQIIVPPGRYQLMLKGDQDIETTGDLDILRNMTITGAGPNLTEIYADNNQFPFWDRIFHIKGTTFDKNGNPTLFVTITNMKISGGYAAANPGGAGILNEKGNLTLINDYFTGNETYSFPGGGIKNTAGSRLVVNTSTFDTNHAYWGGGIFNEGIMTVTNSLLVGNTAYNSGGGIDNDPTDKAKGSATIVNTTIASNSANNAGAGINNSGSLVLTNSTIVGNVGYGMLLYGDANSVFSVTVRNTLFARNSKMHCAMQNLTTKFITGGYNLVDATDYVDTVNPCKFNSGGISTDLKGDPKVTADLAYIDKSPTMTFGFTADDSPAIDAIPASNPNCPKVDQRLHHRPGIGKTGNAAACDIGAYEQNGDLYIIYSPYLAR